MQISLGFWSFLRKKSKKDEQRREPRSKQISMDVSRSVLQSRREMIVKKDIFTGC
jgi:hypothetical protein